MRISPSKVFSVLGEYVSCVNDAACQGGHLVEMKALCSSTRWFVRWEARQRTRKIELVLATPASFTDDARGR